MEAHPEQAVLESLVEHSLGNVPLQCKATAPEWKEPPSAVDVGLASLYTDGGLGVCQLAGMPHFSKGEAKNDLTSLKSSHCLAYPEKRTWLVKTFALLTL